MSRLRLAIVLSATIAASAALGQEPGTAKVSGAEVVNVRQGPGLDHPVIGVLRRGQVLDVAGAADDGQWVHVRSADIDGFVNGHFLELAPTPPPTATAAARPPHSPGQTPAPTGAAPEDLAAAPAPPPGERGAGEIDPELHRQIDQLLSMTDAMHRDVKMLQTLQVADPPGDGISGLRSGLGLLLLGAVVGFVIGNIFGRQQERGSRNRVRF